MIRKISYSLGGLFLVVGALLPIAIPQAAPFVFAIGALLFASAQMSDRYEGSNVVIRRLRRQQVMGALMLLVSAVLMLMSHWQMPPFRGHEWQIALMIAAFLELYTAFRISHEVKKND